MFNPFYNKEIDIYEYGETEDECGISREGYKLILDSIKCDVQPYSKERLQKDYGYDVECTKRIFINVYPEINEQCVIKCKDTFYKIQKLIEWDNYLELAIIETEVDING